MGRKPGNDASETVSMSMMRSLPKLNFFHRFLYIHANYCKEPQATQPGISIIMLLKFMAVCIADGHKKPNKRTLGRVETDKQQHRLCALER